ncbi:HAD family phosphatase [Anaerolineales bacterium HSG25]|nr:HAD family phosphatase [Anaerolineales bacterium HSG25]
MVKNNTTSYPTAVIFDFDGTILDSEKAHLRAYQALGQVLGYVIPDEEYFANFVGKTDLEILDYMIKRSGQDVTFETLFEQKKRRFMDYLQAGEVTPIAGVVEFVTHLVEQSLPLAIASNAVIAEIEEGVSQLGLRDCFQFMLSVESTTNGKPAPDIYLMAAEQLGVEPASCLVYEDSLTGIQAAVSAGMRVVAVGDINNEQLRQTGAKRIISDFRQEQELWRS